MKVRLGYVAIALKLPKITSSSNVTFTNYKKLLTEDQRFNKLKSVTLSNLDDLYKILQYTVENEIHFYRITSSLFPLVTHPEVEKWDYRSIFKKDLSRIGEFIKLHDLRVDTHPNEFNVINSAKEGVVDNTLRNLLIHVHLFEDINYANGKMVIHLGSAEGGKDAAFKRLITNINKYPPEITKRLMFENDDKTFTAKETLKLCREVQLPMVLDIHHHNCNNNGEKTEDLIEDILKTWNKEELPPKFHFSSPRDSAKDRKHADFIDPEDFIRFIEVCRPYNRDIDIMLESKQKDISLFKLVEDIKRIKAGWNWIDKSTFEI